MIVLISDDGPKNIRGDGDSLDISVVFERIRMIDKNEADDKIIAVLKNDPAYGKWTDHSQN